MIKRPKVWTSLGAAALAGTASLALLSGCGEGEGHKTAKAPGTSTANSGEGGEGNAPQTQTSASTAGSGEGEGAPAAVDLRTDHVAYLTQLSLMEGHLLVGLELYKQGALDAAQPHMMHPATELYPALEPALTVRGAPPFQTELQDLADAAAKHSSLDIVQSAYQKAAAALAVAEGANTGYALRDPRTVILLIEKIVRVAGSEYAQAVKDGHVIAPVEYQDAYGFTEIAKARLRTIAAGQPPSTAAVIAQVQTQLDSLSAAWPGGQIVPPASVTATSTLFYGAAARIEIAAPQL